MSWCGARLTQHRHRWHAQQGRARRPTQATPRPPPGHLSSCSSLRFTSTPRSSSGRSSSSMEPRSCEGWGWVQGWIKRGRRRSGCAALRGRSEACRHAGVGPRWPPISLLCTLRAPPWGLRGAPLPRPHLHARAADALVKVCGDHAPHAVAAVQLQQQPAIHARIHQVCPLHARTAHRARRQQRRRQACVVPAVAGGRGGGGAWAAGAWGGAARVQGRGRRKQERREETCRDSWAVVGEAAGGWPHQRSKSRSRFSLPRWLALLPLPPPPLLSLPLP